MQPNKHTDRHQLTAILQKYLGYHFIFFQLLRRRTFGIKQQFLHTGSPHVTQLAHNSELKYYAPLVTKYTNFRYIFLWQFPGLLLNIQPMVSRKIQKNES